MSSRPAAMWSGSAVCADIEMNQARIDLPARFPIDTQPLRSAGPEIVQQHVGLRDQLMNDLLALCTMEVDLDAFLAGVTFNVDDPHAAGAHGLLALRSGVDLDHARAHLREHRGAVWPGDDGREVEYRDALQNRARGGLTVAACDSAV